MKYRNLIIDLLTNKQEAICELLELFGIMNPEVKIKGLLSYDNFTILEANGSEILKIKKKSTGEIITKGCSVYHPEYDKFIDNVWFDESLTGTYYGKSFYKNWIRADGGLYPLDVIRLEKEPVEEEIYL
jgi:hypothetical protein